jgi:hypothetical protein
VGSNRQGDPARRDSAARWGPERNPARGLVKTGARLGLAAGPAHRRGTAAWPARRGDALWCAGARTQRRLSVGQLASANSPEASTRDGACARKEAEGGGATERRNDGGGGSHRRFEAAAAAGEEDEEAIVVVLHDKEDLRDAPQHDNGDWK